MLPNHQPVQHQYPNYNHPSVVSQSPDPSFNGNIDQSHYVYSQHPSAPVYYSDAPLSPHFVHDHGYFKIPSSQHEQSQLCPSPPYSQHVNVPGNSYQRLSHSAHQSASHARPHPYSLNPKHSGGGVVASYPSQQGTPVSHSLPVTPSPPTSASHYENLQSTNPALTQACSSSSHSSVVPSNVSSQGKSSEMSFTTVHKQNRKSKVRHHSISSSGSNDTVTSKRIKGTNKSPTTKNLKPSNHVSTRNRFSVLSDENLRNEDSTTENNMTEDENDATPPKVKIPPIFVSKKNVTVGALLTCLKSTNPDFSLKDSKDFLRVDCGTTEAYRAFCPVLDKKNIEYHTYRLPQEKTIDVVIRHVPIDFEDIDIENELKALGFTDFKLMRVWGKNKQAIPVVSVYLSNTAKNKEIYDLDRLLNCIVLVEPKKRSQNIPQCMNCQRFNHTKNYCKLSPRCMFCSAAHASSACDKMQGEDTLKVCANCGENHSANYKGCSYYSDLKKRRFKDRPQVSHMAPSYSNPPPLLSEFPQNPHFQPLGPKPATMVGDHLYSNVVRTSVQVQEQPSFSSFSMPQFESSQLPPGPANQSSASVDSLLETVFTALKPLFVSLMNKFKPMLQEFIFQLFNGSR